MVRRRIDSLQGWMVAGKPQVLGSGMSAAGETLEVF